MDTIEFKVLITTIKEIIPHSNADRLEIAKCFDFNVVIQKGQYKVGQEVCYIPINSILPFNLEKELFGPDSKIKLHHSRVKQIKIRGFYSQGMIIDTTFITNKLECSWEEMLTIGDDVSKILGITKYEPPVPKYQQMQGQKSTKKENPHFKKYGGIENIKWHIERFEGEEVVIQCKLHGSLLRAMKAPFVANTLWKKIKQFFKLVPKYESVYGSNNVEISSKFNYKGYYGEDVYGRVLKKLDVFNKIKDGECIYSELIGPGIQKGYTYGHKEHHMVLYDVKVTQVDGTQKWLNPEEAEDFAKERGFDFVPILYKGMFSKEVLQECTIGQKCILF